MPPFGNSCEFSNFDACVKKIMAAGKDEASAQAICGALQRDTKARCARKAAEATLKADEAMISFAPDGDGYVAKVDVRLSTDLAKTVVSERRFDQDGAALP